MVKVGCKKKMDIIIPVFLYVFSFFFFIIGLYEERDEKPTVEEEEKSDNMVVIFLVLATVFFFVAGACMMYVTETYYSTDTGTLVETLPNESYRPLGWVGIGFGFFSLILVVEKSFQMLDNISNNG